MLLLLSSYWTRYGGHKDKKDISTVLNEFAYWGIQLVSKTVNDNTDTISVQQRVMEVNEVLHNTICGITDYFLEKLVMCPRVSF